MAISNVSLSFFLIERDLLKHKSLINSCVLSAQSRPGHSSRCHHLTELM